MIDTQFEWTFYWWRAEPCAKWEPIAIRLNNDKEQVAAFLGQGNFVFVENMGGEFHPRTINPPEES